MRFLIGLGDDYMPVGGCKTVKRYPDFATFCRFPKCAVALSDLGTAVKIRLPNVHITVSCSTTTIPCTRGFVYNFISQTLNQKQIVRFHLNILFFI